MTGTAFDASDVVRGYRLGPLTTLKAGGAADRYYVARTLDCLADAVVMAQQSAIPVTVLGEGSNVLASDDGVPGLTVLNRACRIEVGSDGQVVAESGARFQDLFLRSAQASLTGFEYAVGIPGTVGGALVSNAGAYRSCVSEFLEALEVVEDGERRWVGPETMGFGYRDSRLRRGDAGKCVVLRMRFRLERGEPVRIYDEARDYQRQRISKQPPPASAGSFFKNVYDAALAESLPGLPGRLRDAGVVPAGYLVEACGLKGMRLGGAKLAEGHANFILNVGRATATDIRALAELAKAKVHERFGVVLEEEILYLGDWSGWAARG